MSNSKPKGLGRGLSALLSNIESNTNVSADIKSIPVSAEKNIPIEKIHANPDQPRRNFTPSDLENLANSIRTKGLIQPLIVRQHPKKENEFEIVAGERRWRASQMAQLHEIPVIIREFSDIEVLEVAIIENIQREDLNPIDEASGYHQLMERFGRTQEQMAQALGKSRSYIANLLRLLNLPSDVQTHLKAGKLTTGHARALITIENASELAQIIISKGLSVRDTEKLVKKLSKKGFGVLLVLHDLNLAYNFADKIILLKNGKLAHYGAPIEIYNDEDLSKVYNIPIVVDKEKKRINYY